MKQLRIKTYFKPKKAVLNHFEQHFVPKMKLPKILSPVGGKRDKHMVEHEHFNQQRAVQYYVE